MAASTLQDLLTYGVVEKENKETEVVLTESFGGNKVTFTVEGFTSKKREQIRERCKRVYDNRDPRKPGILAVNEERLIGEMIIAGVKEPNLNNFQLRQKYGVEKEPLWELPYAMFTDGDLEKILDAINTVSEPDTGSGPDGGTPKEKVEEVKN